MSWNIPDRWLNYSAVGRRIKKTPFVAFKCPLNKHFFQALPTEEQFGPNDVKTLLPNVSLIIDLTNTDKYYSGEVFNAIGIEHEKIAVPGHVLPPYNLLQRFFHIVDNFISQHGSDSINLIGVHCTHGVNRTGFFICSYMISRLKYSFKSAVTEFNAARGHVMERDNYLQKLKTYETRPFVFESEEFLPPVPKAHEKRGEKRKTQTPVTPVVKTARVADYVSPVSSHYVESRTRFRHNSYRRSQPARNSSTNGHHYRGIPPPIPYTTARASDVGGMSQNQMNGYNYRGVSPLILEHPPFLSTSKRVSQNNSTKRY